MASNELKFSPLTKENVFDLLSHHDTPCVSLYQPTHRQHPENRQDPIRFKGLVKKLEHQLQKRFSDKEVDGLLNKFEAVMRDQNLWRHTADGLAVMAGADLFQVFKIPETVPEILVVSDSYHTKPLRRFLQSLDRYQVLGLSRHKIRLFEGNRYTLNEVQLLPEIPADSERALGSEFTGSHLTVASYQGVGWGTAPAHHGHGDRKSEIDIDTERFFRIVDQAIYKHYSQPTKLPLILAALPEYHGLFREISSNPFLISQAIDYNPDSIPVEKLRELAWQAIEPQYFSHLEKLRSDYEYARSKNLGSDDLENIASAAAKGRVSQLLIEAERHMPGRFETQNDETRVIRDSSYSDDLLDDLSEMVTLKSGDVMVVPSEFMPTSTGAAAIYRY